MADREMHVRLLPGWRLAVARLLLRLPLWSTRAFVAILNWGLSGVRYEVGGERYPLRLWAELGAYQCPPEAPR